MGATLSEQWDNKYQEDEEQHLEQDEFTEDNDEDKLLQKNGQISSQNGKTESQTDEMSSQSEERDLLDVGSGYVTLDEDASDMTDSIKEGDAPNNSSKQMNNTDDVIAKEDTETNNKVHDNEIGLKKIYRFGGFKFTLKKDQFEKMGADEPGEIEQDRNLAGPSEDSWDSADVNYVMTNEQDEKEITNERIGGDARAESPKTHNEIAVGSDHRDDGTPDKRPMQDVAQSAKAKDPMSPIKQIFSQGVLSSLKKKRKEEEKSKENKDDLKGLDKMAENTKRSTKEDTTCTCLDVYNGPFDEDKDLQMYKKDESKPVPEGDIMHSDKVQASPFKRLFRKLSTRRQSETNPGDTNSLAPGGNINENPHLSTETIKSQKEQETNVVETQPANEMMDMSHEESKKRSPSTVSWENLLCVRSARTRSRKSSGSEDETQDKRGVPRRTSDSPFESSTEGDHLTSSNEQGDSNAEEDSGSTWKSFKKLVTPKRRSRAEESGSVEQMHVETEMTKDDSSCSLRKLISGRKKVKPDGQQETISSDEGSKGTGTDIEDDDDTPGVVPLSEYEIAEPKALKVPTDGAVEIKTQNIVEEDKPKQMQPLYNVKPSSFDVWPSSVPIPMEYMEDLTEFLSKHQQLSDIPEEGMIEESVVTPLSIIEWTTPYDTLADDIVDMTTDAVTAPEHTEDETSEMVSAVSHFSESPKTSGNVTPVSPVHHIGESDTIFQEVVESFSMVPSALSNTTLEEEPEARALSVSQLIVESTTTTKVKVFVPPSICIGVICKEIRADVVRPSPLVEGISEINNDREAAEMTRNHFYDAGSKEMKTVLNKAILLDEPRTIFGEMEKKSKQQVGTVENVPEQVSPVVLMEGHSSELLNGTYDRAPVHDVVCNKSLEEQINKQNMNRPETEGCQQPALEEPVYEHMTQSTQIHFTIERQHRIEDVEFSAADVERLIVTEVEHGSESDPAYEIVEIADDIAGETDLENEAQIKNDPLIDFADSHTVQVIMSTTGLQRENKYDATMIAVPRTITGTDNGFNSEEITKEEENPKQKLEPIERADTIEEIGDEDMAGAFLGLENKHIEANIKATADDGSGMRKTETANKTKQPLVNTEKTRISKDVAEDGVRQPPATDNSQLILITKTTVATESGEKDSAKTEAVIRSCVVDEPGTLLAEMTTELQTVATVKPQLDPDHPQTEVVPSKPETNQATNLSYDSDKENNQRPEAAVKNNGIVLTETVLYENGPEVDCNPSDQPVACLQCLDGIDRISSSQDVKTSCVDDPSLTSKTAKLEVHTEIVTEHKEAVTPAVKTFPSVHETRTEEPQSYEEMNCVTNTAEKSEANLSIFDKEESVVEDKSGQSLDEEPLRTTEHVTKTMPNAEFGEGFILSDTEWYEYVTKAVKASSDVSVEAVSEHEVEMPLDETAKMEKMMIVYEDRVGVGSEQVAESHTVTENQSEVLRHAINELVAEAPVVTSPSTGATFSLKKPPISVFDIQTDPGFRPQTETPSALLKEVSENEDVNVNRSIRLEVTEPKLETFWLSETISHTSVDPAPDAQTTDAEARGSVVTSIKEDTNVSSLVLTGGGVPVTQTPADNGAGKEGEMLFTGPEHKERHCDAHAAANIEVKYQTLAHVKVTEIIDQVAEDVETSKSPEERCESLKAVPVKSGSGSYDDIWEDAIDDIRYDQCSSL